jgi:hypothetical protein
MLTHNKYINQMREMIKKSKSNKIMDESNINYLDVPIKVNKLNKDDQHSAIDSLYSTNRIITKNKDYNINDSIKKCIPKKYEFNSKINNYNIINNSDSIFLDLNYENNTNNLNNNNTIFIVMYNIHIDVIPLLTFFMIIDKINELYEFPTFYPNTIQFNHLNVEVSKYIKEEYNYESTVKGVKTYNNCSYIFTEVKKMESINQFNKGIWALPHELINDQKILNKNINNNIYDFFIHNVDCMTLTHNPEKPIVAFQLLSNENDPQIFYTLESFNKFISKNYDKNILFHRVALFIGKINVKSKNDKNSFSDCNSIYKYDNDTQISSILINDFNQIVYLSTHKIDEFI